MKQVGDLALFSLKFMMPYTEHQGSRSGKDMRWIQDGSNLKAVKVVSFSRNRIMSKLNGHIA